MPSPIPIPKKVDELLLEIDEAITLDGTPESVDSTDHNQLEKNIVSSMKPQLLRVNQNGIDSSTIDFTSNEAFFYNLASGNFTLLGFNNAMIGREIKLVVFGANRFLFGAFNYIQIGSHQKNEVNICFVDCVPDQNGNPLFVFRWQNASSVNFGNNGIQEFEEDTNTQLLSILKHTNGANQSVLTTQVKSDSTSSILIEEQNGTDVKFGDIGVSHGFSTVKPLAGGSSVVHSLAKDNGEAELFAQSKEGNFTKNLGFATGVKIVAQKGGVGSQPFVEMEASDEKGAMVTLKGFFNGTYDINTRPPYVAFDNGYNRRSHIGSMSGNIGEWNMDTDSVKEVTISAVGFSFNEITSVECVIENDAGLERFNICSKGAGGFSVLNLGNDIKLAFAREAGSFFDSAIFSNSVNRGRWIIHYAYETFG